MNKRITVVVLAVLMFVLALPVNAAIEATSVEVRGTIAGENLTGGINLSDPSQLILWNAQSFAAFYYDLKDDLGTETLQMCPNKESPGLGNSGADRVIQKDELVYSTTMQGKLLKVVE